MSVLKGNKINQMLQMRHKGGLLFAPWL